MLIYPSLLSNTAGIQETMSSTTKKKRTATPSSIKSFFSPKVEDPDASVKAPTQKILSANFQVDYSSYVEKLGEDTVERVLKRGLDELDELSIDVDGATNDCSSSVRRSSRKRLKVEEEVVEKQDVVQADVPKYEIGTLVEKKFEEVLFHGSIIGYKAPYYKVRYTDGDEEDMSEGEVELHLNATDDKTAADTTSATTEEDGDVSSMSVADEHENKQEKNRTPFKAAQAARKDTNRGRPSRASAKKKKPVYTVDEDSSSSAALSDEDEDDDSVEDKEEAIILSESSSNGGEEEDEELEFDESSSLDDFVQRPPPRKKTKGTGTGTATPEDSSKPKPKSKSTKKATNTMWLKQAPTSSSKNTKPKPKPKRTPTPLINNKKKQNSYTAGQNLPIITSPQAMFDDIMTKIDASQLTELSMILQQRGEPLRVATMCSGTESPILALDMLMHAASEQYGVHIAMEHAFSCEIEPFKAAYIQRNFDPPILYRDVRELGNDAAVTVYGANVEVPGNVDLLIAGTSCVDNSNLNNSKDKVGGESAQTYRGMLRFVGRHLPTVVILENVQGANWSRMEEDFDALGYDAVSTKSFDTKSYYIPQTRMRGYLCAIKRTGTRARAADVDDDGTAVQKDVNVRQEWMDQVHALARPASATLEAFLLPPDDVRLHQGRERLCLESTFGAGKSKTEISWAKCEVRHISQRVKEDLGDGRPFTNWSEGVTSLPPFCWNTWANKQVHRIHDLMDINTLKLARSGVDCTHKCMIWNLSQNADRETMGKLGFCQCLTPTGDFYVTNRGGPLIGEELLLLQGIPATDLILTRETEKELKDLAGNAMSTTVVGTCIISALLVGRHAFAVENDDTKSKLKLKSNYEGATTSLLPKELTLDDDDDDAVTISNEVTNAVYTRSKLHLNLNNHNNEHDTTATTAAYSNSIQTILARAHSSARKCLSEGTNRIAADLVQCQLCGYTASKPCVTPVRSFEEHEYHNHNLERVNPAEFQRELLQVLPMRLSFGGTDNTAGNPMLDQLRGALTQQESTSASSNDDVTLLNQGWCQALQKLLLCEYRYTEMTRRDIWIVTYSCVENSGKLELHLSNASSATWYLFASPPSERGPLLNALMRPLARMSVDVDVRTVLTTNDNGVNGLFLEGQQWEFNLPQTVDVKATIEGQDSLVDSWESSLGLQGGLQDSKRWSQLKISFGDENEDMNATCGGVYQLLPKCGAACGSLHKRIAPLNSSCDDNDDNEGSFTGNGEKNVFFFLESGRTAPASDDRFIFSHTKHRTVYGEPREILCSLDSSYRAKDSSSVKVKGCVEGIWTSISSTLGDDDNDASSNLELVLRPVQCAESIELTSLTTPAKVSLDDATNGWKTALLLLHCNVPLADQKKKEQTEAPWNRCKTKTLGSGPNSANESVWNNVNLRKSTTLFTELAYMTTRLTLPNCVQDWLPFEFDNAKDQNTQTCRRCAPKPPGVRWSIVTKGKKQQFVPIEDPRDAAQYEQALKLRPGVWRVQLQNEGQMRIGIHAYSLIMRAMGAFPTRSFAKLAMEVWNASSEFEKRFSCKYSWRIVPHKDTMKSTLLSSDSDTSDTSNANWSHGYHACGDFPKLLLKSNRHDDEADQPPNFKKFQLRKEQRRSLSWMLQRERTVDPFCEEEVAESVLDPLSWRAEAKVERPVLVRGGIVADEVGYGKTVITLGLIDVQGNRKEKSPKPPEQYRNNLIPTKATLIIVPSHLVGQWKGEIEKFLGKKKRVELINTMANLNSITVDQIQKADIVIVNFTLLKSEKYFERLALLAGRNTESLPKTGRRFQTVYSECLEGIEKRTVELRKSCREAYKNVVKDAETHGEEKQKLLDSGEHYRKDKKKAVYKMTSEEQLVDGSKAEGGGGSSDDFENECAEEKKGSKSKSKKTASSKTKLKSSTTSDFWGLRSISDVKRMKCPPMELFFWDRTVIDEFHYLFDRSNRENVQTVVLGLKSTYRWCLSGTPPRETFDDVETLARLLGIHLGIAEPLPGPKQVSRGNKSKDETNLEKFSNMLEVRTIQWHENRHRIAQSLLDTFVRQNIAEIDEIPYEEHIMKVALPPAERALYLELETHLKSLEMGERNAMKKPRNCRGDREVRMKAILGKSTCAEEALMKCCSHFDLEGNNDSATAALDHIIQYRKEQLEELKETMAEKLAAAFRLRYHICAAQSNWAGTAVTEKGEVSDTLGDYISAVGNDQSVLGGADDDVNEAIKSVLAAGEAKFQKNRKKVDEFYAEYHSLLVGGVGSKRKPSSSGVNAEALFEMKMSLRGHMTDIRTVDGKELRGRVRSLRYVSAVHDYQCKDIDFKCVGHSRDDNTLCKCKNGCVDKSKVGVMSLCGHVGCMDCLAFYGSNGRCVEPDCKAPVKLTSIVSLYEDFDKNSTQQSNNKFGAKLSAIISKVKEIVDGDDRVLIFCQFDDLKKKISEALDTNSIANISMEGTVNQLTKLMSIIQKEVPAKNDPRVLLLKMDDESSAGANLMTCNHAIIVHPLLADTKQQYVSYETQAIGRVRRYGQKKTVHVWRYLVKDSVDTEIFKSMTGLDA